MFILLQTDRGERHSSRLELEARACFAVWSLLFCSALSGAGAVGSAVRATCKDARGRTCRTLYLDTEADMCSKVSQKRAQTCFFCSPQLFYGV